MKEFDVRSGGKKKNKKTKTIHLYVALSTFTSLLAELDTFVLYKVIVWATAVTLIKKKNTIFNMFLHVSSFTNTRTDTTVCLAAYTLSDKWEHLL